MSVQDSTSKRHVLYLEGITSSSGRTQNPEISTSRITQINLETQSRGSRRNIKGDGLSSCIETSALHRTCLLPGGAITSQMSTASLVPHSGNFVACMLCRVISRRSAHCPTHLFIGDDVALQVKQTPSTQHYAYLRQIVRGYLVRTLRRELTFFEKLYKSHCLLWPI